jgi:two-component system, chemotaxis family, protein-glutamate methylesterase/glutaminase
MTDRPIKVLIADDSPVIRALLSHLLEGDATFKVVGAVEDGQAALDFIVENPELPDVVLMDIHMPRMDGFEATRRIMETRALPIVICTARSNPRELQITFRAMEVGALACVEKPVSRDHPDFPRHTGDLLRTLRLMSEVKVVRRWPKPPAMPRPAIQPGNGATTPLRTVHPPIVAIGASTGGPPVLQVILSQLPRDFAAPIVIVQHITPGFTAGLVDWLSQTSGPRVLIASHGMPLENGFAYVAPDDFHLSVNGRRAALSREAPENGIRPAVSHLFRSLIATATPATIAVLLTGMGKDGAVELRQLRDFGAWTIAQDRESSVVHGMPGEAILLGAAAQILPAGRIASELAIRIGRRAITAGEISS